VLTLAWRRMAGPEMTWTFALDVLRPSVRARGDPFFGQPVWLIKPLARVVHFVMQWKQRLGILHAERQPD
jgi:hypothetical protein